MGGGGGEIKKLSEQLRKDKKKLENVSVFCGHPGRMYSIFRYKRHFGLGWKYFFLVF